jgi:hypothetical protein
LRGDRISSAFTLDNVGEKSKLRTVIAIKAPMTVFMGKHGKMNT